MVLPEVQERTYTAEDLWELSHAPQYSDMRLELVEGELIIMVPAGGEHGGITLDVGVSVRTFAREHHLGYTTAAETGYILFKNPNGKDTVQAPDVGFVKAERLPDGLPQKYIPFAPDLAVEAVSPTDTADEVQTKVRNYLKHGTAMVWVFYPKSRSAVVHTPDGAKSVESDGVLDGGEVLPGFILALRDIFPEPHKK